MVISLPAEKNFLIWLCETHKVFECIFDEPFISQLESYDEQMVYSMDDGALDRIIQQYQERRND